MKREYHYIITVQKPHPNGGVTSATRAGIITGNRTRKDMFEQLFRDVNPEQDANVIFFALEPNEMAA